MKCTSALYAGHFLTWKNCTLHGFNELWVGAFVSQVECYGFILRFHRSWHRPSPRQMIGMSSCPQAMLELACQAHVMTDEMGKIAVALTQKRRVRWHSQSADIRRMCLWGDQPLAVRSVQAAWTDICSVITSSLQIGGLDDNFDALLTLKIAILKRRSHSLHRNTKIQGLNILSTTLDCSNKERIDST